MRPAPARAVAAFCLTVLAVACTRTLNAGSLETMLKSQLASKFNFSPTDVTCPNDVKFRTGGTFQCTASDGKGHTLTIDVTQKDDEGNVVWKVSSTSQ